MLDTVELMLLQSIEIAGWLLLTPMREQRFCAGWVGSSFLQEKQHMQRIAPNAKNLAA
jgi:hypothetical protein